MNPTAKICIAIVVLVVVSTGAYYLVTHSNRASSLVSSNLLASTTPSANPDQSRACAQATAADFARRQIDLTQLDNVAHEYDVLDYQNHFNATQGKCFLLLDDAITWPDGSRSQDVKSLIDEYDNRLIASEVADFDSQTTKTTYYCQINGDDCTLEHFNSFVNASMEARIYLFTESQ